MTRYDMSRVAFCQVFQLKRTLQKIAEHALTILINLSGDTEVLEFIATDDKFLGIIIANVVVCPPPLSPTSSSNPCRTRPNPTPTSSPCSSPTSPSTTRSNPS